MAEDRAEMEGIRKSARELAEGFPVPEGAVDRALARDFTVRIMRMLVDDALDAVVSGRDPTVPVCTAKYWCAEQLQSLLAQALRIAGGRAYFHSHPLARIHREAPLALYAGGTVEIQKNLIARSLGL